MSLEAEKTNWKVPMSLAVCVYILNMLLAIDGLHGTETAVYGRGLWFLQVSLASPWLFGLLLGLGLWWNLRRGKAPNRDSMTNVLIFSSMAICFFYDVAYKLVKALR